MSLCACGCRPAPNRDPRPHGLDQSERPRSLQKSVNGAERTRPRESQDEPAAARFQRVAHEHGCYRKQTEYRQGRHRSIARPATNPTNFLAPESAAGNASIYSASKNFDGSVIQEGKRG